MKMKNVIITSLFAAASAVSAQSFVAGWDFSGASGIANSATANWGDLNGSASLAWEHSIFDPGAGIFAAEFGLSAAYNTATVGDSFAGVLTGGTQGDGKDENTGYGAFSADTTNGATQGFQALTADLFTFSFDASGYTGLQIRYAVSSDSDTANYSLTSVDLSSLDGNALATYQFTTAAGASYDNFMITGTAVPEPSAYAAIFGVLALSFAVSRRRRK